MKKQHSRFVKYLSLVTAVVLMLSAAGFRGLAADANAGLSDAFLEYLAENAKKGVEAVDVSSYGVIYSDEVSDAISHYLFNSRPDLFLLKTPVGFSFYSTGELSTVKLHYQYSVAEYNQMMKKAEAAADKLLSGIAGNSKLTQAQKALLLHDRLAIHCEYDLGVYNGAGPGANARNIYGALVDRCAVCDGYTRTYIYLLGLAGIRSVMNRSDRLNHSWNIVYIDGKPYHVDVTFDDPTDDMTGRVSHTNFLLSSAALYKQKHQASDYDTSPDDTRYDSYFWQNSYAPFLLAGGQLYYIDNINASLNRFDGKKLLSLSDDWGGWYQQESVNVYCFARGATDGNVLLYTDKKSVYSYDPASGKTEKVFTPSDPSGKKMIFGMVLEDGKIICDFTDSLNNYNGDKSAMRVTKAFTGHTHTWDGGKVVKEAAVGAAGEKLYTCTVCGATKKETIPALKENNAYRTGDVDGDGKVTSGDARLALRASVKLEKIASGSAAFRAADADRNGELTPADARLILRASVNLEKLPA